MLEALGPADAPIRPHRDLTIAHLAGLRIEQGRIEEAAELLAPVEDRVTSCVPLARVHLKRGAPDLAVAVLHRGLRELVSDTLRIGPMLSLLAVAELQRGDLDAASEAVDRLDEMAAAADVVALVVDARVARSRVQAAGGDEAAAIAGFEQALATLGGDDRPLLAATVRHELAEALVPRAIRRQPSPRRGRLSPASSVSARTSFRDQTAALLRSLGDTGRTRPQRADDVATALSAREQEVLELVQRRPLERRDRIAPVHLAEDRRAPRRSHPDQARRAQPGRGGGTRGSARGRATPRIGVANRGFARRRERRSCDRAAIVSPASVADLDKGHHHAHHDRRDRPRHLPPLDPGARGGARRVLVQPVPRPRRSAVPVPHRHASALPVGVGGGVQDHRHRRPPLDLVRSRRGRRVRGDEPVPRRRAEGRGGPRRHRRAWSRSTTWPTGRRTSSASDPLDIGAHSLRFIPTPHVPHGWESGLWFDETTRHVVRR